MNKFNQVSYDGKNSGVNTKILKERSPYNMNDDPNEVIVDKIFNEDSNLKKRNFGQQKQQQMDITFNNNFHKH